MCTIPLHAIAFSYQSSEPAIVTESVISQTHLARTEKVIGLVSRI
jgi:hypothetical protein